MSAGSNAVDWRILLAIIFAKGLPSALRGVASSSEYLYNLQFLYQSDLFKFCPPLFKTLPNVTRDNGDVFYIVQFKLRKA